MLIRPGVAAVIFEAGRVLLQRRDDTGRWGLPGGGVEPGESVREAIIREVREETGLEVEPVRLLAVLDGMRLGFSRVPMYSMVFLCRLLGGELRGHPLETRSVGFHARDALPQPLAGGPWVDLAFAAIDGEERPTVFDPPRTPPWRGAADVHG
jgi:ADP-ribose pyrophosphatase YjhB (NUDIX family)